MDAGTDSSIQARKREVFWQERFVTCEGTKRVLNYPNADEFGVLEVNEFIGALPPFEGKVVCDLAAGIGRYTVDLAKRAKHVTAVELIEGFTQANEEANGAMGNITFITADVTKITFKPNQFDLIFSNCLLQYMDDTELPRVVQNILRWVNVDGHFFFREVSHLTPGLHDTFKNEEPCICRSTDTYNGLFKNVSIPVDGAEDEVYKFSLVAMNQVQCVKEAFSVEKDFYWIYKKIRCQRSDMSG